MLATPANAALVGHAETRPRLVHQRAGRAVYLGADQQRLGKRRRRHRNHHQVLDVDAPARVGAAAEDLNLGQRQRDRTVTGNVSPQWQALGRGRRLRNGKRHGDQGIAAEPRLVLGPVERNQRGVDGGLIVGIEADQRFCDFTADVADGAGDVVASEARAAVAEIDRLPRSARRAGRRDRPPEGTRGKPDFRLDSCAAAGIPYAPTVDRNDLAAHVRLDPCSLDGARPSAARQLRAWFEARPEVRWRRHAHRP